MTAREKLEAALAQARADRDRASAERAKAGVDWRKHADASVTYDKVRSNWTQADAEWNKANAIVEKLSAELAAVERVEEKTRKRAELEAAVAKARAERDKADAAFAAVVRQRAERDKNAAAAPARVERRGGDADRRKPNADRRKFRGNRRNAQAAPAGPATPANEWADAVNTFNKADAEWNRARAALAELNRTDSKR
jgi:hypothetical protein